jgi:hypothetical protein
MKTTAILLLMIPVLMICQFQKASGQKLEGPWHLVELKAYNGDSLLYEFPSDETTINQIKVWTEDHFIFVGQYESETTGDDSYGWGTYSLKGNQYEEHILYHSNADWVGTSIKMLLEIKKDTLIQIFPVNDDGQVSKNWHAKEKYIRY